MAFDERILKAILSIGFDRASARAAEGGIVSMEDALENLEKQADASAEAMDQLISGTEILALSAENLGGIGRSIVGPLQAATESYFQSAGRATDQGRRWLDASQDLAKAQYQIGKAASGAVLPVMEQATDLAEKAAKFAEEHPEVIQAALKIGAATATLGAVGMAVTKGIKLTADLKAAAMAAQQFAAAKMMDRAAKKQLAAAAGMRTGAAGSAAGRAAGGAAGAGAAGAGGLAIGTVAATVVSVLGGVFAGVAITDILAESKFGERLESGINSIFDQAGLGMQISFEKFNKIITVGVYQLGKLFGGEELAQEWAVSVGELTGAFEEAEKATEELSESVDRLGLDEVTQAYIEHARELAQAEQQFQMQRGYEQEQYNREDLRMEEENERQKLLMQRDFDRDEVESLRDFERQKQLMIRDFAREELLIEEEHDRDLVAQGKDFAREEKRELQEYYRERMEMARDFGVETARMEEDHQREMRYMWEDHEGRQKEAIGARDAMALRDENRSFEKDRSRAEDEYGVEARRRNEDYAQQMAEMEANFARQRAMRMEEQERQIAEEQKRFELERQLRLDEYKLQQQDEQDNYDYERSEATRRFEQEVADQEEEHNRERGLEEEERAFQAEMDNKQFNDEKMLAEQRLAERIRQIDEDTGILGDREREMRNSYYDAMVVDAEVFMSRLRSTMAYSDTYYTSPPGMQEGGYVPRGVYQAGEAGDEFMLNSSTTKSAERMLGGRLSQDAILASLAGSGRRRGGSRSLTVSPTFNGMGQQDRTWYAEAARKAAIQVYSEIDRD